MSNYYLFKQAIILKISGPDAKRYLQSRFTNNINLLNSGESIWTAALSPQGKTEGFFALSALSESFLLLASGGEKEKVLQGVRRFLVADRVSVEIVEDEILLHLDSTQIDSIAEKVKYASKIRRLSSLGYDLIISSSEVSNIKSYLDKSGHREISDNDFQCQKIINNLPDFPNDITPDSLFAESLRSDAISRTKGCYAGQEVVERLSALGTLPAKILALRSPGNFPIAETLLSAEKVAGEIISQSYDPLNNYTYVFARVRKAYWEQELYTIINNQKFIFSYL